MYFSQFVSALPVLAALSSAVPLSARTVTDDTNLYAYGTNISRLGIYYGVADGLAYIAAAASDSYSALTWDVSTSGDVAWNATVNSTGVSAGSLYIVNSGSTFAAAGFLNSTSTLPTDGTTSGFNLFGGQVVYIDSAGSLDSQFWATTTADANVWALKWNSDGTNQDDSTPVVIKTLAPAAAVATTDSTDATA